MKTTNWILSVFAVGMLVLCGCGKSGSTADKNLEANPAIKFSQAFTAPSPELQASISKVMLSVRYGQYPEAIVELDKLVNDATLTEAQKKAVNDMIEHVKKAASGGGAAPPAAK